MGGQRCKTVVPNFAEPEKDHGRSVVNPVWTQSTARRHVSRQNLLSRESTRRGATQRKNLFGNCVQQHRGGAHPMRVESRTSPSTPPSAAGSLQAGWTAALEHRFALLDDPKHPEALQTPEGAILLQAICDALEAGHLRLVEPIAPGRWRVQIWLKRALMRLGTAGKLANQPGALPGVELDSLGWTESRPLACRIPAGSFVRRGAFLAPGCSVMPPVTIQTAACLLPGAQVDSHALIGTGARLEEDTAVGCGTMIGGVLLPEEALPVILERGAIVGGSCGLYESIIVGQGAQIFAGTVIRASAGVYDAQACDWVMPGTDGALRIPAGATVSMGLPPPDAFPDGVCRLTPILG